jgi:hypothetical protein
LEIDMPQPNPTLLSATRWLVLIIMGLFVIATIGLTLFAGMMAVAWPQVLAEISKTHPDIAAANLQWVAVLLPLLAAVIMAVIVWALGRLKLIIDTVRDGDPFVRANAHRLRQIGWVMVGVQVLGLPVGALAHTIGEHVKDMHVEGGFPLNGLLAILLVFVLARVFEQGAVMREDLEGTV